MTNRSLGIRKIRRLNMSRGGREGNNALTKDSGLVFDGNSKDSLAEFVLTNNVPEKTINEMISLKLISGKFLHQLMALGW